MRGTVFRITWDAVSGANMVGVQGNKLRAIEVLYVEGTKAYLSRKEGTNEAYKLPAIASYYETYILPLLGADSEEELDDPEHQPTDALTDPKNKTRLEAAQKQRASDSRSQSPGDPTGNPNNPPGGSTGNQGG